MKNLKTQINNKMHFSFMTRFPSLVLKNKMMMISLVNVSKLTKSIFKHMLKLIRITYKLHL